MSLLFNMLSRLVITFCPTRILIPHRSFVKISLVLWAPSCPAAYLLQPSLCPPRAPPWPHAQGAATVVASDGCCDGKKVNICKGPRRSEAQGTVHSRGRGTRDRCSSLRTRARPELGTLSGPTCSHLPAAPPGEGGPWEQRLRPPHGLSRLQALSVMWPRVPHTVWCAPTLKERKESEVTQSCPTLCDPMNCNPPGSSVHGILQARVLEWVAISFSRGSSQPRD